MNRPAQPRERVELSASRIEELGVVVLPAGLVLLRAAVVVDADQRTAAVAPALPR